MAGPISLNDTGEEDDDVGGGGDGGGEEEEAEGGISWAIVYISVFAAICGFLFGYDTGVVSGAELFWEGDENLDLSSSQIEALVR